MQKIKQWCLRILFIASLSYFLGHGIAYAISHSHEGEPIELRTFTIEEQYKVHLLDAIREQGLSHWYYDTALEIIYRESRWDKDAINTNYHRNGIVSIDHGLCQINDYYWDKRAKELNLDYQNDPFDNLTMCAVVLNEQGVSAFVSMR